MQKDEKKKAVLQIYTFFLCFDCFIFKKSSLSCSQNTMLLLYNQDNVMHNKRDPA